MKENYRTIYKFKKIKSIVKKYCEGMMKRLCKISEKDFEI